MGGVFYEGEIEPPSELILKRQSLPRGQVFMRGEIVPPSKLIVNKKVPPEVLF